MLTPGAPMYGTPNKGANEVRMAYVIECEKIERAIDLLAIAIEEYNGAPRRELEQSKTHIRKLYRPA